MGQTIAEKILSAHTENAVSAGDLAEMQVDVVLANDITAPIAIREFERIGVDKVFDPDKVVLVPDHYHQQFLRVFRRGGRHAEFGVQP